MHDRITKPLVKALLEKAEQYEWSTQGLGMMRLYLAPEIRLHVWTEAQRAESVSELHTHPWDFESTVIAGRVRNHRFIESDGTSQETGGAIPRMKQQIYCGEGGGLVGEPAECFLAEQPTEILEEGDVYTQRADEIHKSRPENGTVTIIERHFVKADRDHALVYWPRGEEWVTAEPRPATEQEVVLAAEHALRAWFR